MKINRLMVLAIISVFIIFFMVLGLLFKPQSHSNRAEGFTYMDEDFDAPTGEPPAIPEGYRMDRPEFELELYPPVEKGKVSSLYGMRLNPVSGKYKFHSGYDIAAKTGEDIHCALDGKVKLTAFDKNGYGNYVVIAHEGGAETLYAHASKLLCKEGQSVKAGEAIAKVGSTGGATGAHLHFEFKLNGERYDPEWLLGGLYN
ncbi:MAG: M23 family metallopeptidase [Oscillospiraceae bacterium]|nr:M23 family metallopeptidase [Oscillospiraceae bacterium]